ncbi:MAG: SDR family oxidoreductase [Kiritimatiellaeota bacterium]|nr:SDR family oxidoreductase [Kiritimatiellota bacterium]
MSVPLNVNLTGKTAVVTGGAGVLCGCMVRALGECGARVAVLDLREDAARATAKEIAEAGGTAIGVACNVLETASLQQAHARVIEAFGPCDILVNGAGGNHPQGTTSKEFLFPDDLEGSDPAIKTFYDLTPDGVQFVFGLNFLGTFLTTQAFSRDMAERGHGTVVNISSMNAFTPLTKIPAYSAAKAAVSNFTLWLAVHMAKVGIRVNAIAPGFFLTEQNRSLLTNPDGSMTPRGQTIVSHTPMGRYGTPDDLLGALLWLVSDEASAFVTGTVIPVDGGFSAFSGV